MFHLRQSHALKLVRHISTKAFAIDIDGCLYKDRVVFSYTKSIIEKLRAEKYTT